MTDSSARCFIKGCSAPPAGTGARLTEPLCERHLAQDTAAVRDLKEKAHTELQPLKSLRNGLRAQQLALAAEMQSAEDLFESAVESLTNWKEAVLTRLTVRHESSLQKLRELSVLQEYEIALAEAEANADLKKVFSLSAAIRAVCCDLNEKKDSFVSVGREIGDVSGGLRDLQLMMDRQLSDVMKLCESVGPVCEQKSICEFHSEIQGLQGLPRFVSSCSNTKGFSADASGKVVKAESAVDEAEQLPEPCLFIAFHPTSNLDCLLACSIDGSLRLKVQAAIDWSEAITGLSCDSKRQALYIALPESVNVADLSGCVSREINSSSLGQPARFFRMTCSSDKIIVLNKTGTDLQLLCIDKDSGQLQTSVSVAGVSDPDTFYVYMSVLEHAVLISDCNADKLYKFCIASGQLILTYPTQRSLLKELEGPTGVVAHRSGLLFVSECSKNAVLVMQSDGTVLQTLGVEDESNSGVDRLNHPWGLAIVEGDSELLAVCQHSAKSIRTFKVCTFARFNGI